MLSYHMRVSVLMNLFGVFLVLVFGFLFFSFPLSVYDSSMTVSRESDLGVFFFFLFRRTRCVIYAVHCLGSFHFWLDFAGVLLRTRLDGLPAKLNSICFGFFFAFFLTSWMPCLGLLRSSTFDKFKFNSNSAAICIHAVHCFLCFWLLGSVLFGVSSFFVRCPSRPSFYFFSFFCFCL